MNHIVSSILFLFVILVANTIQVLTGFAGNMLAMPFSIHLIGVNEAKTVLNVFNLVACLYLWWKNRAYVNKKVFTKIIIFMIIGMLIGIWLFEILPINFLLTAYAILIIIIALYKMFCKKQVSVPEFFMIFVILIAGIIHGMFVSGGALLVIYAVSVLKDKKEFRATLSPVWVVLAIILMFTHAKSGFYTPNTITLIGFSMIPLIISIWLGNKLFDKINQAMFLKVTYILLLISGLTLL
ncbi:sulfite exporter TauE/SafE family protein [Clostridium sp. Marseille-P299]|uniref:sulfite exporter TauE/SafE family protein n=1 Tax=Clostridium sp. Marseille-P299 TaxID=1805477 RepID=UPI00083393CD|nr:sulfite exporter TauE/SafE family protein [Clostridium sp. Marseille-P299]